MPGLLSHRSPSNPLTSAELRLLRSIRERRRLSLRAMAAEIGVPLNMLHMLLHGPSVSEESREKIRAYLRAARQ